jgi:SAM-dependent methyltransferase
VPNVEQNLEMWDRAWDWPEQGDEWSAWWGGTPALWHGALLPRIHTFVPTQTILEIAPGYGRCTQYLKDLCNRLIVVDLSERCIDHCRDRFSDAGNIEYHVNDGRSLDTVDDQSVDFAFSFDSLVHAEADVLEAYAHELARILKPSGVGFIHHTNIGQYRRLAAIARRIPERVRGPLVTRGLLVNVFAWRSESFTAEIFAAQCERAGLDVISQELISWEHGPFLMDAFSVFTPHRSKHQPRRVFKNKFFNRDARHMAELSASSFRRAEPR